MPYFKIKHVTKYTYPAPVIDSANQIMLYPIEDKLQQVRRHELLITGKPHIEEFLDYFGNKIGAFMVVQPHTELIIQSIAEIETKPIGLPNEITSATTQWLELREVREQFPYMDFLKQDSFSSRQEIADIVSSIALPAQTPFMVAQQCAAYVCEHFEYKKGITSVETNVDEAWKLKAGVCQDFANVLLTMLRIAGIPARYVSGYICPVNSELRGEGATHAWVEVYIPFYGWLGIDPTNNCIVSDRHVRLAVGRNFSNCTPVKGTYKGSGDQTLEVSVTIEDNFARPHGGAKEPAKTFGYTIKKEQPEMNSYRRFVEMQQQQ
jgi:transglutaminase-like putative cysteine protease